MTRRPDPLSPDLAPPSPPDDLRTRTLAAARGAAACAVAPDIWTRVWRSRTARLAWAATVVAIAFGHLTLGDGLTLPEPAPAMPLAAVAAAGDELDEIADLPRLAAVLPGFEVAGPTPPAAVDGRSREKS